jgi:hypothetical protein
VERKGVSNKYAEKTIYITLSRPSEDVVSESGVVILSSVMGFSLMLCDSLKMHVRCGFDVLSRGVLGFGGVDSRRAP